MRLGIVLTLILVSMPSLCAYGQKKSGEAVGAFAATPEPSPVRLIFDTDIQGDADDVGAVAVLHALADSGEAEILAMGVSSKNPWSPLCLSALNTYFGRGDIPLADARFERAPGHAPTPLETKP